MRKSSKDFEYERDHVGAFSIWDCGSPLYDSYELVSLSHMVERHMMVWPYLGGPKQIITQHYDPHEMVISISTNNARGSSRLTGLTEFLEKIIWKKRKVIIEGRVKNHKKTQSGLSSIYNRLVCGGKRVT
ncbi:hypothetical protein Lal_00030642 [Lupinus albus]|uniref:Uncharacterized protein n=1 Tax=Lupinus albus TaxID=3870 RepID=A0A6A5LUQ0_LUPAL|nr:hypothetical protein Lalb_Chr17g0342361 [Lupinus albus]KAF1863583.1 hypothetical protein Lal_00030642 [Lupinus albus]